MPIASRHALAIHFLILSLSAPAISQTTTRLTPGTGDWEDVSVDLGGKSAVISRGNDLYLLQVKTGALTPIACDVDDGQIAPGGKLVVYSSNGDPLAANQDGNREIFLHDIDDGITTQLTQTNGGQNRRPAVSSNGSLVVFDSPIADIAGPNADGNNEVYRVDASDLSVVRLTDTAADSSNATISPNGKVVIYESNGDPLGTNADGSDELFAVEVARDGSLEREQITNGPVDTTSESAACNTSGSRVLFHSDAALTGGDAGNNHIFLHSR